MKDTNAAGRKTEEPAAYSADLARYADKLLGLMTEGADAALVRAGKITVDDPHSYTTKEVDNAAKLGEVGVRIIQALAKLKGEFNHKITVRRDEGDAPHDP